MTSPVRRSGIAIRTVSPLWVAEVLVAACGLLTVVISARLLGASDYGVVALAMAVPQLVYSLIEARSGQAAIRFIARYRSEGRVDRARSMGLLSFVLDGGLGLGALAISVALSPWLADGLLGDQGEPGMIIGFAVGVALRGPIAAGGDVLAALERFTTISMTRGLGALSRLGATAGFLVADRSVESVVIGFVVGMAIEAIATSIAAHRHSSRDLGGSIFGAGLASLQGQRRELARFIAYSDATGFLRVIGSQADVLVLGLLATTSEVGSYRLARQLIAPALSLIVPLQSVLLPELAKLHTEQPGAAREAAIRAGRRFGLPASLLFVLGIPLAPVLIRLAGGEGYDAAIAPTRWLMVLGALWTLTFWVQPLVIALGRVRAWTIVTAIGAIVTVTGFWILGNAYGPAGVAASRTIGMAVVTQGLGVWIATRAETGETVRS